MDGNENSKSTEEWKKIPSITRTFSGKQKQKPKPRIEDFNALLLAEFAPVKAGKEKEKHGRITSTNDEEIVSCEALGSESSSTKGVNSNSEKSRKRRPWRQVVRHKAKRLRMAMADQSLGTSMEASKIVDTELQKDAFISKRQKYKIRKKQKTFLLACNENDNNTLEEADKTVLKIDPASRLSASYFRYLNEQLYTQSSKDSIKLFVDDPGAFSAYHKGYKLQAEKWPIHPVDMIIVDLSILPKGSLIADIGCGDAKISKKLGNQFKVHSFDLVALNDCVTVADMTHLPLPSQSVDACVFCLSLMGTNIAEFIREAHRILKTSGTMKIAEISSRFLSINKFIVAIEKMGFALATKKEVNEKYFILMTFKKVGPIKNRRPLGLKLNPCLYRKRKGQTDKNK